ncbi:hypothetical protein PR002_g31135, partial [Phytophthora rubi]
MVAASSEHTAADKSPEQPEQELSPQFVEGFAQGMDLKSEKEEQPKLEMSE